MANLVTPVGRVSYPQVFTAKKNDLNGKDEYSLVLLFDKGADLSALKAAAAAAVIKKWGEDKTKWPANIRTPFRDQGERMKDGKLPLGYEAGSIFITLKSSQRPGLVDQNVQDIIEQADFYAGCYARCTVGVYAYDQKGNRGVSFGLGNIQKVKDGDPLGGGRTKPQDDFAPIEGLAVSSSDATGLFG